MKNISKYHQQGQSLVEFALVLPVLMFLLVLIFDFGRAIYYSSAVDNAAREGARFGIIHPDDVIGMENAAKEYAVGLGLPDITVTAGLGAIECVGTEPNPGYYPCPMGIPNPTIHVTVDYTFIPVTPLVAQFLPDFLPCGCQHISLIGDAIMRAEALPTPP
jgi:hypothetical protein